MSVALHNAPPVWSNQDLVVYHGTLYSHAQTIQRQGVNPALERARTDFGCGFYTTTSLRQAKSWAWLLAAQSGSAAGVVTLTCPREKLATLETLAFVRGDYDAEDFWSFVFHCRQGKPYHGRAVGSGWYDVVSGPVAAFWAQRSAMVDSDQFSFHTPQAAAALTVTNIQKFP